MLGYINDFLPMLGYLDTKDVCFFVLMYENLRFKQIKKHMEAGFKKDLQHTNIPLITEPQVPPHYYTNLPVRYLTVCSVLRFEHCSMQCGEGN